MISFLKHFDYDWKIISGDKPYVFHYTDINALKNILEKRCFWASKSNFLNDYSELQYTKEIFLNVLEEIKLTSDNEEVGFFEIVEKDLESFFEKGSLDENKSEIFLLSFTENEDSLILWSNYSNYDGYNIGFDLSELIALFLNLMKKEQIFDSFYPGKVIYDENEQRRLLLEQLRKIYSEFRKLNNITHESILDARAICQVAVETYSMFFKKSCFKQEEEYRIAFLIHDKSKVSRNVKYRIGKGSLIPYLHVPIYSDDEERKNPVHSITIGPKNNIDISLIGLKHFLANKGFNYMCEHINKSKIPLRY